MRRDQLRDRVFLRVALDMAELATCDRLHVGAVLISPDRKIISTGYNGAPTGLAHCDEIGHKIIAGSCLRTVHAEANAIQQAQEERRVTKGATLYCTHAPCLDCARDIVRADIARVVYAEEFRNGDPAAIRALFAEAGIAFEQIELQEV